MLEKDTEVPTYSVRNIPTTISGLWDLALDLRWAHDHNTALLWKTIDAAAWQQCHSPWVILQELPESRLSELEEDDGFRSQLKQVLDARQAYLEGPSWFQSTSKGVGFGGTALFSLEFGLTEALPIYAGGLGILAGDILKTASDLGVPIVGVGLLYQEGYFRQMVDAAGWQQVVYPYNEPTSMPIQPILDKGGGWLRIGIELPGRTLFVRVWRAAVGRTVLYLLDSNDPLNGPVDRGITSKLYGGGAEMRFLQEMVLGVGGWRVIELLEPDVEVCHLNEGHAAFAVIERARSFARRSDIPFWDALWATRAGNVFTTHTAVPAGFDLYPPQLLAKYVAPFKDALASLGITQPSLLALGRGDPTDAREPISMAYLALRGSLRAFAVSRRHRSVSRKLFQNIFPRWPEREVPIDYVTNGIHVPSWSSSDVSEIRDCCSGASALRDASGEWSSAIFALSDEALWALRGKARQVLVARVRELLKRHLSWRGMPPEVVSFAERVLDPNILTLGFARRFTGYKRPNLLLSNLERLERLLRDPARPAQVVIAGKAHPNDQEGVEMIRQWVRFAQRLDVRPHLVFLEDYDITLAQELVQGVDVWINTPRRPWEACGTSGMKVLVNGGLNLSELDGWWEEAFQPDLGWAIGGKSDTISGTSDAEEAEQLYATLEEQVIPEFYERDAVGIPRAWIARVRASMATLAPIYSSTRVVQEYLSKAYLPAARALRERVSGRAEEAKDLASWENRVRHSWPGLHIGPSDMTRSDKGWAFTIPIYLGEMRPDDVRVEIYSEPSGSSEPEIVVLSRGEPIAGAANGFIYYGRVATERPAEDFTARIVPSHAGVQIPTELPLILWQR